MDHADDGLEWTEKDMADEYAHSRYVETTAAITAKGLNIPDVGYRQFAEEETERVRQMVRQGEYPALKRWLLSC